jgi:hypothetical protein
MVQKPTPHPNTNTYQRLPIILLLRPVAHGVGVPSIAQYFPSNLYPYLDHNHQQRSMSTHAHP